MIYEAPAVSRTDRKRAARRDRILGAAMTLVATEGLAALTVQRLAAELDYTPGALYRYFRSKDALVGELQRHAIAALHDHLGDAMERWTDDPSLAGAPADVRALVALLGAADLYLDLPRSLPQHIRLITLLVGDPRQLVGDDDIAENAPRLVALFAEVDALFRRAVEAGALAPPPTRAHARGRSIAYWAALQGVLQLDKLRRFDPDMFRIAELGRDTARALLAGWGAPPETLDAAAALLRRAADQPHDAADTDRDDHQDDHHRS